MAVFWGCLPFFEWDGRPARRLGLWYLIVIVSWSFDRKGTDGKSVLL